MSHAAAHDFVRDLWRDPALRNEFATAPEAVLGRYPFSAEERAQLLDASFDALGRLGMHPLAQMVYVIARFPALTEQISFRDYLDDLR